MFSNVANLYTEACHRIGAFFYAPSKRQAQLMLLLLGVAVLSLGMIDGAEARNIKYNDQRVTESVNGVLTYLEGSVGALVMVACGIGAIMSSAFGQYRAALGLMVVAVGAFILRSLMSTFFNDAGIQQ